jgi:hypothetical protein
VELFLPGQDIPEAARLFNELLGGHLPAPEEVPGQQVLATADHSLGIAFFGPSGLESPLSRAFEQKPRRGSIGPLVWEVDDLEAARQEVIAKGHRVIFEVGEPGEREFHLDPGQLFGYMITFAEDSGASETAPSNVCRFQRVELLMSGDRIEPARTAFNDLLGGRIPPAEYIADVNVLTTMDLDIGIELFGPASPASRIHRHLDRKGAGAIGPLVFEVDDLDHAKAEAQVKGFRVVYEFGIPGERQVHFDDEQLFGYGVTFTERHHL